MESLSIFQTIPKLECCLQKSKNIINEIRYFDIRPKEKIEEEHLTKFYISLNRLELEIEIILNALHNQPEPHRVEEILDKCAFHIRDPKQISTKEIGYMIHWLNDHLLKMIAELFYEIRQKNCIKERELGEIKILAGKIERVVRCIPHAVKFDSLDIFSKPLEDTCWKELKGVVSFINVGTKEDIKKSFDKLARTVYAANAGVQKAKLFSDGISKSVKKYSGIFVYFFMQEKAKHIAQVSNSSPCEMLFEVLNLFDSSFVKPFFSMFFDPIKFNKLFYVERLYPQITLKLLDEALQYDIWCNMKIPFLPKFEIKRSKLKNWPFWDEDQYTSEDAIPIRLISPKPQEFHHPNPYPRYEELIIHIHGGGWVSTSSFSTQIFTRQFANYLDKPIFSIDYRLAPKTKFPGAIDDCWQAYNWLIDNSKYFNISPKRVILMGESAGGNLALGLLQLLIRAHRRIPDAIFIPYPGLYLNPDYYSPSLCHSLHDPVVSYSTLEFFLRAYLEDPDRGLVDPIASPLIATEEILKQFPIARFLIGGHDPLHDDCWRLVNKLKKVGADVKLRCYEYMPHGFLMFDFPGGMQESKLCIKDSCEILKEILEKIEKKKFRFGLKDGKKMYEVKNQ